MLEIVPLRDGGEAAQGAAVLDIVPLRDGGEAARGAVVPVAQYLDGLYGSAGAVVRDAASCAQLQGRGAIELGEKSFGVTRVIGEPPTDPPRRGLLQHARFEVRLQ